jgi:hypothetical protein
MSRKMGWFTFALATAALALSVFAVIRGGDGHHHCGAIPGTARVQCVGTDTPSVRGCWPAVSDGSVVTWICAKKP